MELKKGLLWASLGAIGFAGLMSALFFLFGSFGETQLKLLLSTLITGWYGMTASVSMLSDGKELSQRSREHDFNVLIASLGIGVAVLGAGLSLSLVWGDFRTNDTMTRWATTLFSLSFALLWVGLVRTREATHQAVSYCSWATVTLVLVLEIMVMMLTWNKVDDFGEFFYRSLAALTVLAVMGSAALPVMKRILKSTFQTSS